MQPLQSTAVLRRLRGFLGPRPPETALLEACAPLFGRRDAVTPLPELRRREPYDSDEEDYTIALWRSRDWDDGTKYLEDEELRGATRADAFAARWVPAGKPAEAYASARRVAAPWVLADALSLPSAPAATPLMQAIALAPLRLVSKSWARMFSAAAIHADAFCTARRLLPPVEAPNGLANLHHHLGPHAIPAESRGAWEYLLSDESREVYCKASPVCAWEPRPAHEELVARAVAALDFHRAASMWAQTGWHGYETAPMNVSDFADALVGREWLVDVERVTIMGPVDDDASLTRFARELMPHNCGGPRHFDPHELEDGKPRRIWRWLMRRRALRVVPFAYTLSEVHDKEGEEEWRGSNRDYRDYVNFPSGGLVLTAGRDTDGRFPDDPYFDPQTLNSDLTAAGELPSSAYRHMGEGAVWAAHELECAAARDRRTAAGFPTATRSWDTAKPVAALEASSAAYSAMAAACRRSSRLPVLHTLCAMRALVAAKRAHAPASGVGLLCRASLLPRELFRRICLMAVGDGDVNVENIALSRIEVRFAYNELYSDEDDSSDSSSSRSNRRRIVSRCTHRRIFPRVVLTLHDVTTRSHELKITGRLSGFEMLFPEGSGYHDCEPDAKRCVMNNLRKIAAYKAAAMPKQVGRNFDLLPKYRHGGTSGVGWNEPRESV